MATPIVAMTVLEMYMFGAMPWTAVSKLAVERHLRFGYWICSGELWDVFFGTGPQTRATGGVCKDSLDMPWPHIVAPLAKAGPLCANTRDFRLLGQYAEASQLIGIHPSATNRWHLEHFTDPPTWPKQARYLDETLTSAGSSSGRGTLIPAMLWRRT